jgi:hypothetical protein
MARVTLRGRGSTGVVAIWTGDDDDPFDTPLDHLDRVKFHSSLAYPKVISEWQGTVNFPRRSRFNGSIWVSDDPISTVSYTLFAHGRSGQPWVLGSANIGGQNVAMVGSVPVQQAVSAADGKPTNWVRWVSLGADDTNVYVYEYTVIRHINSSGSSASNNMPAIDIDFTVWVTDEILSA